MTRHRLVFLDVDGTILDHSQVLAPSVPLAVRTARERGHLVYLCTGRARVEIPPIVRDIGFDGEITAGGGYVEHHGELISARPMPPDVVREIIHFFEQHGVEYMLQGFDGAYPSEGLHERAMSSFAGAGMSAEQQERVAHLFAHRAAPMSEGIAKATFFGSTPHTFATVRDGLGDRFHVITGTIPYLGGAGGEVSLEGTNKGAAIRDLVRALGSDIADTIAIGDSVNDIEMLQAAGVGIAMGNADAAIKALADEITADVEDDGVWQAFRRHRLI